MTGWWRGLWVVETGKWATREESDWVFTTLEAIDNGTYMGFLQIFSH